MKTKDIGSKLVWANFLHWYLAPTMEKEIVDQVVKESYRKLVAILKFYPRLKLTMNITGCLTEMLVANGYTKLIDDIKKLLDKKQIELTDSAAYHPLLPLVPEKEVISQIEKNNKINSKYFGANYQPNGFFLPELAYSQKIAKLIDKLGYKWILLDEISFKGKFDSVDFTKKYKIKDTKLFAIFRSRAISKSFVPQTIQDMLKNNSHPPIIISATDAELYGHRHDDREKIFQKVIRQKNLKTITISDLLASIKKTEPASPIASNWESLESELKNKIPYGLWSHPKNTIQKNLWQLAGLAAKLVNQKNKDPNHYWARWHLNRGLASCTFWWASGRDFRLFGPPAWKPDEIEKGGQELIKSIRSLETLSNEKKLEAEKLYLKIKRSTWSKHWKNFS